MNASRMLRLAMVPMTVCMLWVAQPVLNGNQVAQATTAHRSSLLKVAASAVSAPAQDQTTHLKELAALGNHIGDEFPVDAQRALSAAGQQVLGLPGQGSALQQAAQHRQANNPGAPEDSISQFTGMTQSETSNAWCGSNAVIGYNDSGSFVATLVAGASPSGSLSLSGFSRSTNSAGTWTDRGPLLADPLPPGLYFRDIFGDPVVACSNSSTFYYANIGLDTAPGTSSCIPFPVTQSAGMTVSRSTDGGQTFGPAVMAVSKDACGHFLDKEWMAVSPGATPASDVLHVTYTDFDFTGLIGDPSAACPGLFRTAIEYVRSADGGQTWSKPAVIKQVCSDPAAAGGFLQGSHVAVGNGSDVYVAYETFGSDAVVSRSLEISKSTDGGLTFGAPVTVAPVTPIGDGYFLRGHFRVFLDLQGLVVDRSNGPNRGSVYITWHDGRNLSRPDPFASGFSGMGCTGKFDYCFGDVLSARSRDGGATWSAPVRVNNDPITSAVDQYMPGVDVDSNGTVYVAFFDRRRDSRNFLIDTYLASSTDGGNTWSNQRLTSNNFAPVTGWEDAIVNPAYMGDYLGVAGDATRGTPGVIVSWGDNSQGDANVMVTKR